MSPHGPADNPITRSIGGDKDDSEDGKETGIRVFPCYDSSVRSHTSIRHPEPKPWVDAELAWVKYEAAIHSVGVDVSASKLSLCHKAIKDLNRNDEVRNAFLVEALLHHAKEAASEVRTKQAQLAELDMDWADGDLDPRKLPAHIAKLCALYSSKEEGSRTDDVTEPGPAPP